MYFCLAMLIKFKDRNHSAETHAMYFSSFYYIKKMFIIYNSFCEFNKKMSSFCVYVNFQEHAIRKHLWLTSPLQCHVFQKYFIFRRQEIILFRIDLLEIDEQTGFPSIAGDER